MKKTVSDWLLDLTLVALIIVCTVLLTLAAVRAEAQPLEPHREMMKSYHVLYFRCGDEMKEARVDDLGQAATLEAYASGRLGGEDLAKLWSERWPDSDYPVEEMRGECDGVKV